MKYVIVGGFICLHTVSLVHAMDIRAHALTCELSQSKLVKQRAYGQELPQEEACPNLPSTNTQCHQSEVVFDSSYDVKNFLRSSPSPAEWELLARQKQQQQSEKKAKSRRAALALSKAERQDRMN